MSALLLFVLALPLASAGATPQQNVYTCPARQSCPIYYPGGGTALINCRSSDDPCNYYDYGPKGSMEKPLDPPTKIDVKDREINFGNVKPEDVFERLFTECSSVGCSGGKEIKVVTNVIENGNLQSYPIIMTAEGSFNPTKKATRDALVAILKKTAAQLTKKSEEDYWTRDATPFICKVPVRGSCTAQSPTKCFIQPSQR
jgi:hypothetical protein